MAGIEVDVEDLTERLAPIGVTGIQPLSGGASSLTYLGTLGGDDARRVVVKVAPPGVPPVLNRDVLRQARLLRALQPTEVPVPEVLWEDGGDPPVVPPLFVMTFLDGVSFEPLFDTGGTEDESVVAERERNAARTMAALHAVEPDGVGLAGEPRVGPAEEIDRWCRLLETVDQSLVAGWKEVAAALHTSEPEALDAAVVHGDFRLGNLLAVGSVIRAVVDWEIWSVGDPRVDVGWFLLNADPSTYDRATGYASAMPARDELTEIYTSALGRRLPDLHWFQSLACFKSTATWSLIVKHNRRRDRPDPEIEEIATALPRLLTQASSLLAGGPD
jgi:aminoglycoside phosphotransferase (APT) family kinase protein